MCVENRVEYIGEEGNRSLWKVIQFPIRDNVRAWSLIDLETLDGFVNIVSGG